MSKPGAKKALRQRRKQQQKQQQHAHQKQQRVQQKSNQVATAIPPTFDGEQVGAPTTGASWLGQKIAALLRFRKA
ncbi:hypothetical protein [Dictyobacter kobayashii]|uniref:Uncharacterized protein n=1 Tax=Dictyobacter kobayashii TaxID=2014872 RepID=A0A402AQI3_9CHLR|nr:hypothetical protein [Dictyobacter kobayashii]GCE21295.1 hypothetical protein KDK_50950 [Dictyobacter kobayashii]